jgi:hypothetical protein
LEDPSTTVWCWQWESRWPDERRFTPRRRCLATKTLQFRICINEFSPNAGRKYMKFSISRTARTCFPVAKRLFLCELHGIWQYGPRRASPVPKAPVGRWVALPLRGGVWYRNRSETVNSCNARLNLSQSWWSECMWDPPLEHVWDSRLRRNR